MKHIVSVLTALFLTSTWVAGIVLAKGFWSTLVACVFPFWGWYLIVEKILGAIGWI